MQKHIKTYYIHFITKSTFIDIVVGYNNNLITRPVIPPCSSYWKSWKAHIDQYIPNLCTAYYAVRVIKPFLSQGSLNLVYYSCFHSLMNCGIILWGISLHSIHVFRLHKRVIRIITVSRPRDSCKELLKKKIKGLPFQSQYIFLLLLFVVKGKDQYNLNYEIHSINTR
jgi:hypothetical protein